MTPAEEAARDARFPDVATFAECRQEVANWPLLPDDEVRRIWSLFDSAVIPAPASP